MKYIPDRRQNCRPQRMRRITNQPTSAKPTSVKRKTLTIHSRLVNHSVDQLIDSIHPPSFGPTEVGAYVTPSALSRRYSVTSRPSTPRVSFWPRLAGRKLGR